jgi:hypothetical protein
MTDTVRGGDDRYLRTPVAGTAVSVATPRDWVTAEAPTVAFAAVDPRPAVFAPNVTVAVDPARTTPAAEDASAMTSVLVAPVIVDLRRGTDEAIEIVVCHLVGTTSVTALQRNVGTPQGVVSVTFSCATAEWPVLESLAEHVVASVQEMP